MSPSAAPLPRFFVDRSLGAVVVPGLLRAAGFTLETMRERYGERRAQRIADVEWLADVGAAGLAVLMKDKHVRTRPAEQAAVRAHGVRCFCLTRGSLTGADMAAAFVAVRAAIFNACAAPGPFIYQVNAAGLTRVL